MSKSLCLSGLSLLKNKGLKVSPPEALVSPIYSFIHSLKKHLVILKVKTKTEGRLWIILVNQKMKKPQDLCIPRALFLRFSCTFPGFGFAEFVKWNWEREYNSIQISEYPGPQQLQPWYLRPYVPSFIFLFDLLAYKKVLISGSSIRKYYIGRPYSFWKRTDILSIFFRFFFLCFILGSSYSYSSNSRVFSFAILVCHPTGLFFISDIVVFIYFFVYVLSVCI